MVEEFEEIEFVETSVEERVHAFESGLPQVQAVVDCVLERAHLNLANQFFTDLNKGDEERGRRGNKLLDA